ncbi:MAG: leucyl aminopeptidase family protein [Thermoplasmata archaeon]|nr:leucyl aminopeptidase family protein [Thermoplasmata archaeon]
MKWSVGHSGKAPKGMDCVVLPVFKEELRRWKAGPFRFVENAARSALGTRDFEAARGEVHVHHPRGGIKRLVLLGMGKRADAGAAELLDAYSALGKAVSLTHVPRCTFLMTRPVLETAPHGVTLFIDGFSRGCYRFDRYLSERKKPRLKGATVLLPDDGALEEGLADAKVGGALAEARRRMMDIANEPPNVATPERTANAFVEWFADGQVKVKVLKRAHLQEKGFNLVLAVGGASANEPRMAIIEYRGGRPEDRPVVLVGKGVTFDGGGLSLKPTDGMTHMKQDMSGAAAVAATIHAAAALGIKVNVIGIAPLVENVIGPSAFKVSDVIAAYGGRTVEVANTDAEGRLILADALAYAVEMRPAQVIDIATLTGAAIVALGKAAAATMGNDRAVLDRLAAAAAGSGERVWELPLWDAYAPLVESKIADVRNVPEKREAGSIVGGKFLEGFVGETPWAHIDMAPTFVDGDGFSTGYGVGLLLRYLMMYAEP